MSMPPPTTDAPRPARSSTTSAGSRVPPSATATTVVSPPVATWVDRMPTLPGKPALSAARSSGREPSCQAAPPSVELARRTCSDPPPAGEVPTA